MNILIKISLSFVVLVAFFSCSKKANEVMQQTSSSLTRELIIKQDVVISETGNPYAIDSVKINKDTLSVFVNYTGGCKEHNFDLFFNGKYAKSYPLKATLCLKHNANEDKCKKLVMQELKFIITSLKESSTQTLTLIIGTNYITYNY